MQVIVDGDPLELADSTTVADVVLGQVADARRVAVARNGEVVPRSAWPTTRLTNGDAVEVLVATAGG